MLKFLLSVIALLIFSQLSATAAAAAEKPGRCSASAGLTYVCGTTNAEDLVVIDGTDWVLSSAMTPGGGIYLVDSTARTWAQAYPDSPAYIRHDKDIYGFCPGAPALEHLETHGLNIRPGDDGHSTLYVVGHGGREAIEVFDVDSSEAIPSLTWIGCVPMPTGFAANSVASFGDGSLAVTVLAHPGDTFSDVFSGKLTGAVYRWSPGDEDFELIKGTRLPGNNGIEISPDEREIFVVSTGLATISVFSNSNPAELLRTTDRLEFGADNIHLTADGQLITAGPSFTDHQCGAIDPANVDLAEFASCPKGFVAATIDPETMQVTRLASGPANPEFSNATMAIQVAEEVWIGSFSGDRIGIVTAAQ